MIILGITASSDKNAPTAPTSVTATDVGTGRAYNNGAITVAFTAPSYTGGAPITSYTATSNTGGYTATGVSSPLTVTGIPSNTALTFTVTATNALGFTSPASSASNSATATTVPQAPTIGTATDLGTGSSVSVSFTAGATGGKAVSTYTATSSPSSITGTAASSPITVTGLSSGTAYTFTVTATNANGTSTASAASNSVTPAVPSDWELITSYTGNNSTGTVTFSGLSGSTYKRYFIIGTVAPSSASYLCLRVNGATSGYGQQTLTIFGSSTGFAASGVSQNYVIVSGNNINIAANQRSSVYMEFMGNADSANDGIPCGYAQCSHGTSDNNSEIMYTGWGRSAQADLSSIEVFLGVGQFIGTTTISLYGVTV